MCSQHVCHRTVSLDPLQADGSRSDIRLYLTKSCHCALQQSRHSSRSICILKQQVNSLLTCHPHTHAAAWHCAQVWLIQDGVPVQEVVAPPTSRRHHASGALHAPQVFWPAASASRRHNGTSDPVREKGVHLCHPFWSLMYIHP